MSKIHHWATGIIGAAILITLAGCGGGTKDNEFEDPGLAPGTVVERSSRDQRAADRRDRERQRIIAEQEADFSFFRYRIDLSSDQPKACLIFSGALDPEIDYANYVDFRPSMRPALSVEGRELCVGGLSFGEERTAILKSGLPAADGRALDASEEVPIDFADRPPYVGFKGSGVILPRKDADGLPIETVNVDAVKVTVSRINDRALVFKSITQGETSAQGRYSYAYGNENPTDVSTELWSGTMDVTRQQNAPVITVFPLADVIGELEPGSYYVEITDARELTRRNGPPASARRWIMMTDLALTAFRGEHGLDITLRSLQSGKSISGLKVDLIARSNEVLATGQTDGNGRIAFAKPIMAGSGNTSPKLILAYGEDGELAALDLTRAPVDLSSESTGGRRTPGLVDAYVYTERGIYRPGETVHLTALLRDRAGVGIDDRSGSMIIYRPNGLEASRIRFDKPGSSAVQSDYDLSRGAARGMWRAVADIDGMGVAGSVSWSVEDFVPQRIKVELEVDDETPIQRGEIRGLEVEARFLYGAPGAGLTVKTQARLEADPNPFEAFEGFRFGSDGTPFREEIIEFTDQTADGAGKAIIPLDPGRRGRDSDRPLRLNTVVSVLEPGGRAVSNSVRVPYRPRDLYVGTKAIFDGRAELEKPAIFELAAINAEGDAQAARLGWKILEINWHYDWYRDGSSWRWRRSREVRTVNEGIAVTKAGSTAEISVEGLDWGDHELIVTGPDGEEARRKFWVGWGGYVSEDGVEAPDRVTVTGPGEAPQVGRNVQIAIAAPYDGEAEIVVATDRVISIQTRSVSADGTQVSLPVTEEWGEGAYIMVTVYSPRDPALQAKPRRAVGVAYVATDVSKRTFELTINAPNVVRPRREQLITVDIEDGPREPVYLTLAAVDEGILQLTKFSSPNPVDYFFGKKALGVALYDDYGRLLDPNLGLPAEVRTGGDQLGGEGLSVVPTKTVALFSGLVDVGRNGKAQVRLELPDFNGELRLMAVAWSETGLGSASQPMIVRDPVPAELILPRFLAPGDEALVTASIDNVELESGQFDAVLTADGPVSVATGNVTRTLATGQRADEAMRITTDENGISRLRFNVDGPANYVVDHQYQIETRSPYLPVTEVSRSLMQPGEAYALTASLLDDFVPGSSEVTVSFSNLPMDPGALYASLARYPYGCTEQTTSRALPLLYAEQLVAMGAEADRGNDARHQVQEAVTRVLNRQSADGAFGLWREGDRHASPWLGAYTTDFLLRAKEEGYVVPQEALDRAYGALRNIAQGDAWRVYGYDTDVYEGRWHTDTQQRLMQRSSAFALYVLAKAGKADISRLRYLHDRQLSSINSPLAKAHLAAGLAYMGDRARARSAFDAAIEAIGYQNNGDYYQTPLRDTAAILSLAAETDFADVIETLAEKLGMDAPDPQRLTTQEKAFALLAVNGLTKGEAGFSIETEGEGLGRGNDNDARYRLTETQAVSGASFTIKGEAPVFRTVMVRGSPSEVPRPASEQLTISKQIFTQTGGRVDMGSITQGDQFVIALRVTPEQNRVNPVIVADLLPAGFEIETILQPRDGTRDSDVNGAFAWAGRIAQTKTAEARDDRFIAAIDVRDQMMTLAYIVRAVTPGEFAIPGATAEDMYRPDVYARSQASRITIAPSKGGTGGQQ